MRDFIEAALIFTVFYLFIVFVFSFGG